MKRTRKTTTITPKRKISTNPKQLSFLFEFHYEESATSVADFSFLSTRILYIKTKLHIWEAQNAYKQK